MKIPEGYRAVMPYLIVRNASGLISFAEKIFNAKEKFKEMIDEKTVRHAELIIGDSIIMLADATEKFKPQPAGMFIYVDNADDTFSKALSEGASVITDLSDQSYGRSGGIKDPFGNTWWITSIKENVQ